MYSLLLSLTGALLVGLVWTSIPLWGGWVLGSILGLLTFLISNALIARKLMARIQPVLQQAAQLGQAQKTDPAIELLKTLLPFTKWQLLLDGQLQGQIGVLYYSADREDEAISPLTKASSRFGDAKLYLAAIQYRRQKVDTAIATLLAAIRYNKRHMLLHNFLAWVYVQSGQRDRALEQLNKCLKVEGDNEATKDNLNRVQNDTKLNMRQFGMPWYSLKFETMPQSMGVMQGRKGFRQAPKGPKPKGAKGQSAKGRKRAKGR